MKSWLPLPILVALVACSEPASEELEPWFETTRCTSDGAPVGTECGRLWTDRSGDGSRELALFVERVPATGEREGDPVLYLAGGPGGTRSSLQFVAHPLREHHELVLLHQRGAGISQPSLDCPEIEAVMDPGTYDDTRQARDAALREAAADCFVRLQDEGIDPSAFSTAQSARDVEALRVALGVDRWVLFGSSYGSTLALEVLRAFPDSVSSVVLTGPAPPDAPVACEHGRNADDAVRSVLERCQRQPDCPISYEGVLELLDVLDSDPPRDPEIWEDGVTLVWGDGAFVFRRLSSLLRVSRLVPQLPSRFARVSTDRDRGTVIVPDPPPSLSEGLHLSIQCAELARCQRDEELPAHLRDVAATLRAQCEGWGTPMDGEAPEPVESAVPTLILVGEFDPVTPPRYARMIAETLDDAHVIVVPGAGHDALDLDCSQEVITSFVADPTRTPSAACLDAPPEPFVTLDGTTQP